MPEVSIIIPVYNVESYLRQCLDSVQRQTLRDIEIICIDDGSTDSSGEICNQYAANDNRFVVIHQANAGQSVARNKGLDIAQGKYIAFLDSDDWLDERMCETALTGFTNDAIDIVQFLFRRYDLQGNQMPDSGLPLNATYSSTQDKINLQNYSCHVIWNKLYKKDFIEFNQIRFLEGCLFEDVHFSSKCAVLSNQIICIPDILYYYRIGCGYSSNDHNKTQKIEIITLYNKMITDFRQLSFSPEILEYFELERFSALRSVYRHQIPKEMRPEAKRRILESLTESDWEQIRGKNRHLSARKRAFFYFLSGKFLEGILIYIKSIFLY